MFITWCLINIFIKTTHLLIIPVRWLNNCFSYPTISLHDCWGINISLLFNIYGPLQFSLGEETKDACALKGMHSIAAMNPPFAHEHVHLKVGMKFHACIGVTYTSRFDRCSHYVRAIWCVSQCLRRCGHSSSFLKFKSSPQKIQTSATNSQIV